MSCQAAGMNGFLVKPISLDDLRDAVLNAIEPASSKQLSNFSAAASEATAETADSSLSATAVELEDLSVEAAFEHAPSWSELVSKLHNNERLLRDVMTLLIREAPRLSRSFSSSLAEGNLKESRRAVHTLKSNARHVGLNRIASFAEKLEYLARDDQTSVLAQHEEAVEDLAIAIAEWAEKLLKENP